MAPPDDPEALDERFVRAAVLQEASGRERAERARRVTAAHRHPQPWRAAAAPAPRPRLGLRLVRVLLGPAVVVGALALPGPLQDAVQRVGALTGGGHDALVDVGRALPPVPEDAGPAPLGTPASAPAGDGGFALQAEAHGARVDPCRPLHWVMRDAGAPAAGRAAVQAAVARVAAATGLRFVDDGGTDEGPSTARDVHQPERYGDRWAPLLVAWSDAREHPPLDEVTALGGSSVIEDGGQFLVAGVVYLDRDDLVAPDGALLPHAEAVVVHELGHVLGLDHVDDLDQLMHAGGPARDLGPGDLRGLAQAASGPCSTRRG